MNYAFANLLVACLLDGNLRHVYRRYLHRQYPYRLATVSARQIVGLRGQFVSRFLIKIFLYNYFKSRPISRQIQIATLESKGIAIRYAVVLKLFIILV